MSVSLLRPFPSGGLCGRLELMQKEPRRGCELLLLLVTVIRQLMQALQGNISPPLDVGSSRLPVLSFA